MCTWNTHNLSEGQEGGSYFSALVRRPLKSKKGEASKNEGKKKGKREQKKVKRRGERREVGKKNSGKYVMEKKINVKLERKIAERKGGKEESGNSRSIKE
jgi:hypothetical protein